MSNNAQLNLIAENAKWVKDQRDEEVYSLNYNAYQNQRLLIEKDAKRFDAISDYTSNLAYESLPYELELYATDTILKEKRDRWHTNLTGDVYVEEAINVLEDIKLNNIKRSKVAIKN